MSLTLFITPNFLVDPVHASEVKTEVKKYLKEAITEAENISNPKRVEELKETLDNAKAVYNNMKMRYKRK